MTCITVFKVYQISEKDDMMCNKKSRALCI